MLRKFKVAFRGLFFSFSHKAVFIQILLAALAMLFGLIINLNYIEWLTFILCIGIVIGLEIINTAIENICNLIDKNYNEDIRNIKDMAAGAVLCVSIMSVIICIVIFVNKIMGG